MSYEGEAAGAPGHVQVDFDDLRTVVAGWRDSGQDLDDDGMALSLAFRGLVQPTDDVPTADYFAALGDIITEFHRRHAEMADYLTEHVDRIVASGARTAADDAGNAARFPAEGAR